MSSVYYYYKYGDLSVITIKMMPNGNNTTNINLIYKQSNKIRNKIKHNLSIFT